MDNNADGLSKEAATFTDKKSNETYEQLPSLKLVSDKDIEIDVDFSKPFHKWTDDSDIKKPIMKAIIPITSAGVKMNLWLNIKNPLYPQLINAGRNGQTHFKIHTEGKMKDTKYSIV